MTNETIETAPSKVRFAERCDLDQVLFLCRELHAENGLFDMSDDRVRDVLMTHFDRAGGIIGVIGEPGCLEGAIVMRMSTMWYSDQSVLEELFSFVLPEFRRSNNAKDLIDFAKSCAQHIGVPFLSSILLNPRTERKAAMYRRRIGSPVGVLLMFQSETATQEVCP